MKYTVTLNELPERYVMSVRNIIPSYQDEGTLWHTMMSQTTPQNVKIANPCYGMAIFHDKEYKENDVDVEIQMTVEGKYENTKDVVFKKTQSVKYASVTYKGSMTKLEKSTRLLQTGFLIINMNTVGLCLISIT